MSDDVVPYAARLRPGRPGVSQIDVDRAADALMRRGERPSIEKVRADIGGSPNTLAPLLDDWWRRLAARVDAGPGAFARLPGSLALSAEAFFLSALEQARETAQTEEARARADLAQGEDDVAARAHVLSLREAEWQQLLEERAQTIEAQRVQLREQALTIRKLQATQGVPAVRPRPHNPKVKPKPKVRARKKSLGGRKSRARARHA